MSRTKATNSSNPQQNKLKCFQIGKKSWLLLVRLLAALHFARVIFLLFSFLFFCIFDHCVCVVVAVVFCVAENDVSVCAALCVHKVCLVIQSKEFELLLLLLMRVEKSLQFVPLDLGCDRFVVYCHSKQGFIVEKIFESEKWKAVSGKKYTQTQTHWKPHTVTFKSTQYKVKKQRMGRRLKASKANTLKKERKNVKRIFESDIFRFGDYFFSDLSQQQPHSTVYFKCVFGCIISLCPLEIQARAAQQCPIALYAVYAYHSLWEKNFLIHIGPNNILFTTVVFSVCKNSWIMCSHSLWVWTGA